MSPRAWSKKASYSGNQILDVSRRIYLRGNFSFWKKKKKKKYQLKKIATHHNQLNYLGTSHLELHISRFLNFPTGNGKNDQFPVGKKPGNREKHFSKGTKVPN